ncbi:hypothetical protein DMO17_14670 [Aquipseudomonas alcaligenes]|uniref:Uncharacterized protein n=1 Tax=Aquipseudomonas alcaligenes TaxID=43263 RepID=A0A2V4KZS0_AQUAC|nr:hypothetical protein DMO17_14670 [Pseudomonas alcaligenes]
MNLVRAFIVGAFTNVYLYLLSPVVSVVTYVVMLKLGVRLIGPGVVFFSPGLLFGGWFVYFFWLSVAFAKRSVLLAVAAVLFCCCQVLAIYLSEIWLLSFIWVPVNIILALWIYSTPTEINAQDSSSST